MKKFEKWLEEHRKRERAAWQKQAARPMPERTNPDYIVVAHIAAEVAYRTALYELRDLSKASA